MEGSHFGYYGVVVGFGGGGGEEREAGLLMTWCCGGGRVFGPGRCVGQTGAAHRLLDHRHLTPPRRPLADSPLVAEEKRLWMHGSVMISVYDPKLEQE